MTRPRAVLATVLPWGAGVFRARIGTGMNHDAACGMSRDARRPDRIAHAASRACRDGRGTWIRIALAAVLACAALPAAAATDRSGTAVGRPVVVELFTSEACSSCPPADRLLAELATTRRDVLPLDEHVTYWNGPGWRDPFSLDAATSRQDRDAARAGSTQVYTPEIVVDGGPGVVGSDRQAVLGRIAAAEADAAVPVPIRLARDATDAGSLSVTVGPGAGTGTVILFGVDPSHDTAVGGGENGGRRLHEVAVVRSIATIGAWNGKAIALRVSHPAGALAAVLLQANDGHILGAAAEER